MDTFQILLIIHIIFGIICLFSGVIAMSAKKRRGIHTKWGELYHASYVVIFITAIILSILRWEEIAYLFYVALFSYSFAIYGYLARKRRWKNWIHHHIRGMLGSYIGAVTALLVNVGNMIPLLNQLPKLWLWFIPTIIGTPLIYIVSQKYTRNKKEEPGKELSRKENNNTL
ncbi:alcohol dehydrogenase [Peribacillus butanolivorans]|uniref:DUF2306 domain-containing protein n=1 Tax=Peribacillus butanolivorans TaxID=421767 RepID=UPI0006A6D434|nr:DUF2306 domain-containing protein [Peribacillus butanolivorans]KON69790.1 alcohol dehydrogenase [Peribacillus butanolivorans]KQU15865.1 alcohol dehydrogenase [Bacillus sp. Leaf13]